MTQLNLELQRITIDCPNEDEAVKPLKPWLAEQAEKDGRSLSNYIIRVLQAHRTEKEAQDANN